jgi:hypothetical protein
MATVLHELENHTQVLDGGTRPGLCQLASQLMSSEGWMKGIFCQKLQHRLQICGH